jgi:DNA-directed RNA polymerase subunit E'/Rpb7
MDQPTSIFYKVLLNDKVKIEPKYLCKGFRDYILGKLKKNMEGICSKHGFIKENSIELYKVSPGNVDLIGLNGFVVFDVYYYADVCNPLIGNVIKANVVNVNKFGILADVMGILEIIIAKNSVNITHDNGISIDSIKIGDTVFVEIVGKKYELFDKKISIVGRLVTNVTTNATTKSTKAKKHEIDIIEPLDDDANDADGIELNELNEDDVSNDGSSESEDDASEGSDGTDGSESDAESASGDELSGGEDEAGEFGDSDVDDFFASDAETEDEIDENQDDGDQDDGDLFSDEGEDAYSDEY